MWWFAAPSRPSGPDPANRTLDQTDDRNATDTAIAPGGRRVTTPGATLRTCFVPLAACCSCVSFPAVSCRS